MVYDYALKIHNGSLNLLNVDMSQQEKQKQERETVQVAKERKEYKSE